MTWASLADFDIIGVSCPTLAHRFELRDAEGELKPGRGDCDLGVAASLRPHSACFSLDLQPKFEPYLGQKASNPRHVCGRQPKFRNVKPVTSMCMKNHYPLV